MRRVPARQPRVHAVRDDEVELAGRGVERREVRFDELDVRQPEGADRSPPLLDRSRREVAADEAGAGQRHRHRDEVSAVVAADLEQAARLGTRREVPDECRHGLEPRGVRRPVRQRVVRDLVVAMGERDVRAVDDVQHGVRISKQVRKGLAVEGAREGERRCTLLRSSRRKSVPDTACAP